jgi:hypothetical protein
VKSEVSTAAFEDAGDVVVGVRRRPWRAGVATLDSRRVDESGPRG